MHFYSLLLPAGTQAYKWVDWETRLCDWETQKQVCLYAERLPSFLLLRWKINALKFKPILYVYYYVWNVCIKQDKGPQKINLVIVSEVVLIVTGSFWLCTAMRYVKQREYDISSRFSGSFIFHPLVHTVLISVMVSKLKLFLGCRLSLESVIDMRVVMQSVWRKIKLFYEEKWKNPKFEFWFHIQFAFTYLCNLRRRWYEVKMTSLQLAVLQNQLQE